MAKSSSLIDHQGIICYVAFPPEAGKRSLLSFDLEALDRLAAYKTQRLKA